MYKSIWMYPWNLKDEGIDYVMDIVSKIGLNAISVTASYHAGKFICPHNPKNKVYFPEDGVVYFRPDLNLYEDTKIKPYVSSLVKKTDLFKTLTIRAGHHGLNLVAWTVCLHNTRIGREHPDCTVRNAFGDSYIHSLCPSNEDVREYIKSLVKDISSNYNLYAVELESPGFMAFEHGFHHEIYEIDLNFLQSFLLSLCFCKNCEHLAKKEGINVDKVRKKVKDILNNSFSLNIPGAKSPKWTKSLELINMLICDEEFYKYLVFRNSIVTRFIKEIKAALPSNVKLFVIILPSISEPSSFSWVEGMNIKNIANIADAVEILSYFESPNDVYWDAWFAKRMVEARSKLHVGLRPCFPDAFSPDNLVKKLEILNKIGVNGVSFYNYGHMQRENLWWIEKSLNILRNSSSF